MGNRFYKSVVRILYIRVIKNACRKETQIMKMGKVKRVLTLYVRFTDGQSINICNVAKEFSVNEKSVRRDISDIRAFLADEMVESGKCMEIVYDRLRNIYYMSEVHI